LNELVAASNSGDLKVLASRNLELDLKVLVAVLSKWVVVVVVVVDASNVRTCSLLPLVVVVVDAAGTGRLSVACLNTEGSRYVLHALMFCWKFVAPVNMSCMEVTLVKLQLPMD